MEISLIQLQSYLYAIEQISKFTPKRWDLVSECVAKLSIPSTKITASIVSDNLGSEDIDSEVNADLKLAVNGGGRAFSPNPKCCKDLFVMLLEGTSGYTRTELQAYAAKVLYHDEECLQ